MPVRILIAAFALSVSAFAQPKAQSGAEVRILLTVADHMNHQPAALKPGDVTIKDATITEFKSLEGGRDLELFILIDDASNYDFGSRLKELGRFVGEQPAATSIGLAYIHDGALKIVQNPTTDRNALVHALRAPSGSKSGNPYCALSDLIQSWKDKPFRREVLFVTAGIDDTSTEGVVCSNAETALNDAERAGVVVYSLYHPAADYRSEKWSKVDAGLVDLAHICYETGGEAYFLGHDPATSIEAFLSDISEHLARQYLVKFRMAPEPEAGFRQVYVSSGAYDLEIMKQDRVWIPLAGGQ